MKQTDQPLAHEIITLLLEATKVSTAKKIYRRVWPGEDGNIRTKLSPVGTETGRLSSAEDKWWPEPTTNLQNLPKKIAQLDPLFDVRNTIVPSPGYVFLEADLSQAEALVTAAYANDVPKLKRMLKPGSDEHSLLASVIYGIPVGKVNAKTQRPLGKMGNHALNYGAGWQIFMGNVNKDADLTGIAIDAKMAKQIIEGWKDLNSLTVKWWDKVVTEARTTGCLTNPFGRKRIFVGHITTGKDVIAYLPQSTIADLLNHTLVELFAAEDGSFRVVHQIHDAILVEARSESWFRVARLMKRIVEQSITINGIELVVPVDVSLGKKCWGKMKEVVV